METPFERAKEILRATGTAATVVASPDAPKKKKARRRDYTVADAVAFFHRMSEGKGSIVQVSKSLSMSEATGYQWTKALQGEIKGYTSLPKYLKEAIKIINAEKGQETEQTEFDAMPPKHKFNESNKALQALRIAIGKEVREEIEQRLQKALTSR